MCRHLSTWRISQYGLLVNCSICLLKVLIVDITLKLIISNLIVPVNTLLRSIPLDNSRHLSMALSFFLSFLVRIKNLSSALNVIPL